MKIAKPEALLERHPISPFDPHKEYPPEEWFIENMFLSGGKVNGLFGAEKSGKSRLLNWIIASALSGLDPWVGAHLKKPPQKIFYMRGEENEKSIVERLVRYSEKLRTNPDEWVDRIDFMDASDFHMERESYHTWLLDRILQSGADLVVMDPLRRMHGANEDSSNEMAPIHGLWRRWTDRYNFDILVVHHTGKVPEGTDLSRIASWTRGTSDFGAILDSALMVMRNGLATFVEGSDAPPKQGLQIVRAGRFAPVPQVSIMDNTDDGNPVFEFSSEIREKL